MKACSCTSGPGNTGTPNCLAIFDVTKKVIFVEYYKQDGSINGIDLSAIGDTFTQADLDALIRDVNPRERFYPTPELKNITDERGDNINEEFEDGSIAFIQEGARVFTGFAVGADPVWIGQLNSWRCLTTGFFLVDKAGNLIGSTAVDGFLNPIKVQDETMYAKLVKGSDTTIQKGEVGFVVEQTEDDGNLGMIENSSITANLLGASGMIDVLESTTTDISVTGFTSTLKTKYGDVLNPILAIGMEATDFALYNNTTSEVVTIDSVTETPEGTYAFAFTDQNASDELQLSNAATDPIAKAYDLESFTIDIPA